VVTDAKVVRRHLEEEAQIRREVDVWSDWIREVLVPRAYVGVVGAPTASQEDGDGGTGLQTESFKGGGKARSLAATSLRVTGLQSGGVVDRMYDEDDLGELVERTDREEMSTGHTQRRSSPPHQPDQGAAQSPASSPSPPIQTRGKRKVATPERTNPDELATHRAAAAPRDESASGVKPGGKESTKSKTQPKRKKRKNAIDDMFAGFS